MNLFLVKTKFIGDSDLDREVFVVIIHGRMHHISSIWNQVPRIYKT
jgi:hypothetical protein